MEAGSFVDLFVDMCVAAPAAGFQIWASAPATRPTVAQLPAVERVLAVGDLHGDYQKTRAAFEAAGIVQGDHWSAGTTTVVQVGDQLDRGGDEMAILLLLERLKVEAAAAGGALYTINGNHETMSVRRDFRYADPKAWEDFDRWAYFYKIGQRLKRRCGLDAPTLEPLSQAEEEEIPPHKRSRWQALR